MGAHVMSLTRSVLFSIILSMGDCDCSMARAIHPITVPITTNPTTCATETKSHSGSLAGSTPVPRPVAVPEAQ